jgi:hypothetical protein
MAAERPSIQSVKNDIVIVSLPYIEGTKQTYLTSEVAATGTTLTVKDNADLANNDYLVLGQIGSEQTEIVKIGAAVTPGTSLTVSACVFPHPIGTKITLIRYNQVAIYGSTSASDTNPTIIGSVENLDVANGKNEIKASTTYAYYYARYYNSTTTTYSSYSDSVAATGLNSSTRGEIKKEFLSMFNETVDDLITDDWMNRTINRWQRELSKRRRYWSVLKYSVNINLIDDTHSYDLPTDMQDYSRDSIISVKVGGEPELIAIDQKVFTNLTYNFIGDLLSADVALIDVTITLVDSSDFSTSGTIQIQGDEIAYTGNTKTTGTLTGVTGITSTHTAGDEVWQTYSYGQPQNYLIDPQLRAIRLFPVVDSVYAGKNLTIEYWRKFVDLTDDADETLFTNPENCYYFLNWQLAIRRKLPGSEVLARKAEWQADLENLVANDPDYRQVRIEPNNLYNNPY